MNKDRRNRLKEIAGDLEQIAGDLQDVLDEETEAMDNLPESFQYSDMSDAMSANIDIMDGVIGDLSAIQSKILQCAK